MSLAKVSKGLNVLLVIGTTITVVLMSIVFADTASARPHGITIGHSKCHKKHHKCRKHHRRHHPPRQCKTIEFETSTNRFKIITCGENAETYVEALPIECDHAGVANYGQCPAPVIADPATCEVAQYGCKELTVSQPWIILPGGKGPSHLTACVRVFGLAAGEVSVEFHALKQGFGPAFFGGNSKGVPTYCAFYEEDSEANPEVVPPPGPEADEVWAEVKEYTGEKAGRFVESEHAVFFIEGPEIQEHK